MRETMAHLWRGFGRFDDLFLEQSGWGLEMFPRLGSSAFCRHGAVFFLSFYFSKMQIFT